MEFSSVHPSCLDSAVNPTSSKLDCPKPFNSAGRRANSRRDTMLDPGLRLAVSRRGARIRRGHQNGHQVSVSYPDRVVGGENSIILRKC